MKSRKEVVEELIRFDGGVEVLLRDGSGIISAIEKIEEDEGKILISVLDTPELTHEWGEGLDRFFERIERNGGWPEGFGYVGFAHSTQRVRHAEFTTKYRRDEWWTTLASVKDYYVWKLSRIPDALQELRAYYIRNWIRDNTPVAEINNNSNLVTILGNHARKPGP